MLDFLTKTIIVTGHYGSGKTNLAVNLALDLKKQGKKVVLVDMDIVNPYFRSADFGELAKQNDIQLVASQYANSNVELATLSHGLSGRLNEEETFILDVGGDETGAIALSQYVHRISQIPYTMLCVVNRFRSVQRMPEEDARLLKEIETTSRLSVTHIVNNSNLGPITTPEDIAGSVDWARQVAVISGKQLAFSAARRDIAENMKNTTGIYPVDIHVKTVWQ